MKVFFTYQGIEKKYFYEFEVSSSITVSELIKFEEINIENIQIFVIGFFASFASAFLVIKFLISYLKSHSLIVFAVYRILAGILIIFFGTLV